MEQKKINLLEGSIFSSLVKLSIPLMATAFINMAYNITDTAWLGSIGKDAVAGTSSTHYIIWMALSIMIIPKIGTSIYTAQEYGKKDYIGIRNTIKNGLILNTIIILIFMVIVLFFGDKIIGFYNLDENVTRIGVNYLKLIALGSLFSYTVPFFAAIYNSLGNSVTPFKIVSLGLILNVFLDPIFIFYFNWGYKGAAYATILSQLIVFVLFVINIVKTENEIFQAIKYGVLDHKNMLRKIKLGFPAGSQSLIHATISFTLSRFITTYGSAPFAAANVGAMIESITWMTIEGFQVGITAIVGQNFGARKHDRLVEIIKTSMKTVGIIGICTTFILIVFRGGIFRIIVSSDPETVRYGEIYLLILGISQFFMGIEIGAAGVFNGLGNTKTPAIISMTFNLFRIPLALLLMPFFEFKGVWMAITISSIIKGTILNILLYNKTDCIKRF